MKRNINIKRNKMKTICKILYLVVLIHPVLFNAQTISNKNISGFIQTKDGTSLGGMVVYLNGGGQSTYTTTNQYGQFQFSVLPGNYNLTFKEPPELKFSKSSLSVDVRKSDKTGIIIQAELSSKTKNNIKTVKKYYEQLKKEKGFAELSDVILSVACNTYNIPIAPFLTGDPSTALPPGIKVYFGSGNAIIVNGKVLAGDKNARLIDPNASY